MLQGAAEGPAAAAGELAAIRTQIPDNPALPALIRDLTAAGKKAGVEHRLDGAGRCRSRWSRPRPPRSLAPATDGGDAPRVHRIDRPRRTASTRRPQLPALDALPGAADAQGHRQLLRAGAVRQQARDHPAGRSWSPASRSSRGSRPRTRSRGRPHDHHRRSRVPQPAGTRPPPTTPVVAPATADGRVGSDDHERVTASPSEGPVGGAPGPVVESRRRRAAGTASLVLGGGGRRRPGRRLLAYFLVFAGGGETDTPSADAAGEARGARGPRGAGGRQPPMQRINAKSFGRDPFKALIAPADPVGAVGGTGTTTVPPTRPRRPAAPRPAAPRPAARTTGGTTTAAPRPAPRAAHR